MNIGAVQKAAFFYLALVVTVAPQIAYSQYLLPYPSPESRVTNQSNNGATSHRGGTLFRYAVDFDGTIGVPVTAMRGGTVLDVGDGVPGIDRVSPRWPGNFVIVDHGDGTLALYAHLRCDTGQDDECVEGSILVSPGTTVVRGQQIGQVGNTGHVIKSVGGNGSHLHVQVILKDDYDARNILDGRGYSSPSQKFTFDDVNGGTPQAGKSYRSSNALVLPQTAPTAGFTMTGSGPSVICQGACTKTDGQTLSLVTSIIGATITLDAAGRSMDSNGAVPTSYIWSINGVDQGSVGVSFSMLFAPDTYNVSLVVIDNKGAKSDEVVGVMSVRELKFE